MDLTAVRTCDSANLGVLTDCGSQDCSDTARVILENIALLEADRAFP